MDTEEKTAHEVLTCERHTGRHTAVVHTTPCIESLSLSSLLTALFFVLLWWQQVRRLQSSVRDLQNALRLVGNMDAPARRPPKHELAATTEPSANPYSHILANNGRGVLHGVEVTDCRVASSRRISSAHSCGGALYLDQRLQESGVAVLGLNGMGTLTAEAFARYGVKDLVLIDNAEIALSDLGSMQFQAQDVGKRKDETMAAVVRKLNPDVRVRAAAIPLRNPHDVIQTLRAVVTRAKTGDHSSDEDSDEDSGCGDSGEDSDDFDDADDADECKAKSVGSSGVHESDREASRLQAPGPAAEANSTPRQNRLSAVFLCVQHGDLASALNEFCCEVGMLFVYVFVGRNGISGEILSVIPGRSSCLQCLEKRKIVKAVSSKESSATDATQDKEGVFEEQPQQKAFRQQRPTGPCLPSTECILSGLSVQNAVMALLSFGSFCSRVEYDGFLEEMNRSGCLPPVHLCPSAPCRQQQQAHAK